MANQIKEREKELILAMMMALKETQVDENFIKENIEKIFQLEVQENMGYKYIPVYTVIQREDGRFYTTNEKEPILSKYANRIHLDFEYDYENNTTRGYAENKDIHNDQGVTINLASDIGEMLRSSKSTERVQGYKELVLTLLHENQHIMEGWMNRNSIISNENIMFARDQLLMEILEEKWYSFDERTGNYASYTIENDADKVAYKKYLEIMEDELEYAEKSELEDNVDILEGKINLGRYKLDSNSIDGKIHYKSDMPYERDDITIPILDDIIASHPEIYLDTKDPIISGYRKDGTRKSKVELAKDGRKALLDDYPILREEYNEDGTKKTAIELIRRMQEKIDEVNQDIELSPEEKEQITKDRQEFYYELIYNALERNSPDENKKLSEELGQDETKELLTNLQQYFQNKNQLRKSILAKMSTAQQIEGEWIEPINNGKIRLKVDADNINIVNKKEFVRYMTEKRPELMEQEFTTTDFEEKEIKESGKEIIEKNFDSLPQSGNFISGRKAYRADAVMEDYLNSLSNGNTETFLEFVAESGLSTNYNEQARTISESITRRTAEKNYFIQQISEQIFEGKEIEDLPKSKVAISTNEIKNTLTNFPVGWNEIIAVASKIAPKEKQKDSQNQER